MDHYKGGVPVKYMYSAWAKAVAESIHDPSKYPWARAGQDKLLVDTGLGWYEVKLAVPANQINFHLDHVKAVCSWGYPEFVDDDEETAFLKFILRRQNQLTADTFHRFVEYMKVRRVKEIFINLLKKGEINLLPEFSINDVTHMNRISMLYKEGGYYGY